MTDTETERKAAEEAFEQGFHGIPSPQERAKMSAEKLAIELSKQEKCSPPYILLEHELNLRLAKEQAKATLSAGWLGASATVIAVFLSIGLGYLAGASQSKEPKQSKCEKSSAAPAAQPDGKTADSVKKSSAIFTVVPLSKGHAQNAAQPSNDQPKP